MPEVTAQKKFSCPSCGGEMIQKSRARLIFVGLCLIALVAIAFAIPLFWAPGIILALTGILHRGKGRGMIGRGINTRHCFFPIPLPIIPLPSP